MFPRRLFLAALPALAAANPARAQFFASDVSGDYQARGRNPDGSPYKGAVRITQSGDEVAVKWRVGASTYSGTGTRAGRVVEVDWGDKHPVYYVVMGDGELHGTWADGEGLEKLVG